MIHHTTEGSGAHASLDQISLDHEPSQQKDPSAFTASAFSVRRRSVAVDHAELQFKSETPIGEGSIARVFKAKLRGRRVAVKILKVGGKDDSQSALDMEHELGFLSGLEHPNIIEFLGAGITATRLPMLVFELAEGGSVADLFASKAKRFGRAWVPPRAISLSWCQQLFSALTYLHTLETPIVHRDIKPANVLLSKDLRTLKMGDFSLATTIDDETSDIAYVPSVAGSLRFMAPEIMTRKPFALAKTDIYSATVTSWSLIHGRLPFEPIVDSRDAIAHAIRGNRPPVDDYALREIFSAGWHASPARRPSAQKMLEMLSTIPVPAEEKKNGLGSWVLSKVRAFAGSRQLAEKRLSLAVAEDALPRVLRASS